MHIIWTWMILRAALQPSRTRALRNWAVPTSLRTKRTNLPSCRTAPTKPQTARGSGPRTARLTEQAAWRGSSVLTSAISYLLSRSVGV
uniref:Putative secreted protein n=1 Tax=Ixodes scapularis TaxID=6945 RepID=A0A4D5RVD4_IXOSC